jgi:hypothetical protein
VTSPPYVSLKEYRKSEGQLGYVADFEAVLTEIDKVWKQCFDALVPRPSLRSRRRLLSRREERRRLTSSRCTLDPRALRVMGYDNWRHHLAQDRNASSKRRERRGVLGQPYERNDRHQERHEFI